MPASVASGDVLVAQVAVRGGSGTTITAPNGWTFIRQESSSTFIKQALYYRVAGSSGPSSYTWNLSSSQYAAGGIAAYIGVDSANPVETSNGQASKTGTTITALSVTTSTANDMILGFFSTATSQTISTPTGMNEHWDLGPGSAVDASEDDVLQTSAGASGDKVATVSGAAAWVGQLVALKPACTGGSLSLTAPADTASWSALTLNGTDQTTSTTLVLTPDDETGSGSGWNITGTSTTLTNASGRTLPTTATTVTAASAATHTGNCSLPTNSVGYPVTLPAGPSSSPPLSAVKLYNAAANTGSGPSDVTLTFQLAVAANSYLGTYTSTWTFAIVSGP